MEGRAESQRSGRKKTAVEEKIREGGSNGGRREDGEAQSRSFDGAFH